MSRYRTTFPMLAIFHLMAFSKLAAQAQLQKRDLDPDWVSDPAQFFRRSWQNSIVLDDYIYIDGGEVIQREGIEAYSYPMNSTYSLPVHRSWEPSTVRLTRIDKGDAPVHNAANLFASTDNQSFYLYNGGIKRGYGDPPDHPQLWQFVPDGAGSGAWKLCGTPPNALTGSEHCGVATTQGLAYILGGIQDRYTTKNFYPNTDYYASADGLVVYDMESQQWTNRTITQFRPSGWAYEVQLQHLIGIGNSSLLLAMGGKTNDASYIGSDFRGGEVLIPYQSVSIYNTDTQEWWNQSTTGDIPDGRDQTRCCVGLAGDNGTFEIFLHGGSHPHPGLDITEQPQANQYQSRPSQRPIDPIVYVA